MRLDKHAGFYWVRREGVAQGSSWSLWDLRKKKTPGVPLQNVCVRGPYVQCSVGWEI